MLGLLYDAVDSVVSFVQVFVYVYSLLILAYIITSWVRLPYSLWLNRIQRFLYDVCDPYLRLWRRILPTFGPLDLSPVVGVASLYILESRQHPQTGCTERGDCMTLTPVEIRHRQTRQELRRRLHRERPIDRLAGRDRRQLRRRLARARRPRGQGRAARGRSRALPRARGPAADRRSFPRRRLRSRSRTRPGGGGAHRRGGAVEARAITRDTRVRTTTGCWSRCGACAPTSGSALALVDEEPPAEKAPRRQQPERS